MLLKANFVFIAANEREGKDGKKYCNVTVESNDHVVTLSCDPRAVQGLKKYQSYTGIFEYATYKDSGYLRFAGVAHE